MKARQIIMQLYDSGELQKACRSIGGSTLSDDLTQEVLLCLFTKPERKIVEAHEKGYFRFYVVRIAMNFARSKNAEFHKLYRHLDHNENIDDLFNVAAPDGYCYDSDSEQQEVIDRINQAYQDLGSSSDFPYEQKLLDLHLEMKSKKAVSRLTGIPYRTVLHNLESIKQKLRNAALNR